MNAAEILADAFGRIGGEVHDAVTGLTVEQLAERIAPEANTIAWLVWHLTRVQDDHVAEVAGTEQVWTSQGWFERFDLSFSPGATGYGQTPAEVAEVRVGADLLTGYYDAVAERTLEFVRGLSDADLDRVVDDRWDPPVTLGVRLVSVIGDDEQNVGQAAYVRGILLRG